MFMEHLPICSCSKVAISAHGKSNYEVIMPTQLKQRNCYLRTKTVQLTEWTIMVPYLQCDQIKIAKCL